MRTNPPDKLRMLGVEDVRETNELKLLHIIRDRQPISRADLVKATGLRAGTVSVIVNRLLRASVVHEGEAAPSSGGVARHTSRSMLKGPRLWASALGSNRRFTASATLMAEF